MTCEKCGHELKVGDFPFCPHETGSQTVIGDEVPGGFWAENGFSEPRKFYSHSEHEAALAAEGYEIRAKNAGQNDKIMSNWAAGIDAQTLANAADLLSRKKDTRWKDADAVITVTELGTFTAKDL